MADTTAALRIIRDEHAALASVLHALLLLVRDARHRNRAPDFRCLRAMLFYVDEFPERLHHVKETTMLFPRLRELTSEADAVLKQLDGDHASGARRVRELEHLLTAWELLGEARRPAFERALDEYVEFYLNHMRVEETAVLPLAERCFGAADWLILERAFGTHRDALAGAEPEAQYAALFRTLASVTPCAPR
ncbi:hemerythrin domain-containing protein [Aquabacterium sp. J223]|uniref:hemerythrin domain-containing protein n=1 Tax=Aquabacterium sp. J223 TaxID=2898431 RepID=UPI0021AE0B64|nr:hemerythrin domain-containing protein [Aquabacterium sp. J223]UUX95022.1 hemerythrin domain-containing protein [Aquabacterium sp. J223]